VIDWVSEFTTKASTENPPILIIESTGKYDTTWRTWIGSRKQWRGLAHSRIWHSGADVLMIILSILRDHVTDQAASTLKCVQAYSELSPSPKRISWVSHILIMVFRIIIVLLEVTVLFPSYPPMNILHITWSCLVRRMATSHCAASLWHWGADWLGHSSALSSTNEVVSCA
jgi:hypothetical protein